LSSCYQNGTCESSFESSQHQECFLYWTHDHLRLWPTPQSGQSPKFSIYTERTKSKNLRIDDVKSMIFDKLDRLMPNTVDFTDSVTDSTYLYYFVRKKPNGPNGIRTHNPWIRFQHKYSERPSDLGSSASYLC
jgi:hypothetical protein